jgi:NAD(P)-dependent dehydrogenase (short-subunit alcohol dehydrogenase family)
LNKVIVTGANCGIGYEAALDLAKRGAHVILACRDMTKAQLAQEKIIAESKNNQVDIEKLDCASFQSVREFADRFKAKYNRLDILINNAGLNHIS